MRATKLSGQHQDHLRNEAIPQRVQMIRACLARRPVLYPDITAAAIHARAIAAFLGIRVYADQLVDDHSHHRHEKAASWEIKITDFDGCQFVDLSALDEPTKGVLIKGLLATHREIAHLTFWDDPIHQTQTGAPSPGYQNDLEARIRQFATAVIALLEKHMPPKRRFS